MGHAPGTIRDSIVGFLESLGADASVKEIERAVVARIGDIPPSSVRSYLNLNVGNTFERTTRGRYQLRANHYHEQYSIEKNRTPVVEVGKARLYEADCFSWLAAQKPASFHACITDPPYGLVEYSETEQAKLRNGKGGVWRIPPAFDGHKRPPCRVSPYFATRIEGICGSFSGGSADCFAECSFPAATFWSHQIRCLHIL